ncbi:MAG: DUF805 domain-containing protein [Pseudomonadota bacterium]
MGPISAVSSFFMRCFDVQGRSRRSEYLWMTIISVLFSVLVVYALILTEGGLHEIDEDNISGGGMMILQIVTLISLITIIPWTTLSIRRFHDMNHTGWLVALFMGLWVIPPIGALGSMIQFFWMALGSGTAGHNPYGLDPRFSRSADFI